MTFSVSIFWDIPWCNVTTDIPPFPSSLVSIGIRNYFAKCGVSISVAQRHPSREGCESVGLRTSAGALSEKEQENSTARLGRCRQDRCLQRNAPKPHGLALCPNGYAFISLSAKRVSRCHHGVYVSMVSMYGIAAVMRRVYMREPSGTGGLARRFGGRNRRRGVRPNHCASGARGHIL